MTNATPESPRSRVSAKLITVIVLLVLALIFIFSNLSRGTLFFLGFSFTAPAWIWFLTVLVVGIVIGSIFPWGRRKKQK